MSEKIGVGLLVIFTFVALCIGAALGVKLGSWKEQQLVVRGETRIGPTEAGPRE